MKLNEFLDDIAIDLLKSAGKGIGRLSRSRIDDFRKDKEDDNDDNTTKNIKRSSGSDDYDHIIKKHMKR